VSGLKAWDRDKTGWSIVLLDSVFIDMRKGAHELEVLDRGLMVEDCLGMYGGVLSGAPPNGCIAQQARPPRRRAAALRRLGSPDLGDADLAPGVHRHLRAEGHLRLLAVEVAARHDTDLVSFVAKLVSEVVGLGEPEL
jgi:hypothetical protein